jgi:hypothetical protein
MNFFNVPKITIDYTLLFFSNKPNQAFGSCVSLQLLQLCGLTFWYAFLNPLPNALFPIIKNDIRLLFSIE